MDAVIILISIQRKKCTFYSRFLPSLIRCSMSSQNQPRNFFRSNYWCVIQLSSQLFYQTLQKGLVERKKGKKWGLWNEIKGQSTNKVIKEIITFACRLSLCVIALFLKAFVVILLSRFLLHFEVEHWIKLRLLWFHENCQVQGFFWLILQAQYLHLI